MPRDRATPIRVLIVDDDREDFLVARAMLAKSRACRFETDWCSGHAEALEALREKDFDVCLLDYRLQVASGLDTLERLRSEGFTLPVIVLTGQGGLDVDLEALAAGADDYLEKNELSPGVLERSIRYALRRREAERERELAATVFETTTEGIVVTDAENRILTVNPAFQSITGYTEEEVVGNDPAMLGSGHHDAAFFADMWQGLQQDGRWEGEIWNRRKDGRVYPQWIAISVLRDRTGRPRRHVAVFSDISERKAAEEAIHYQANYDALTDLPNRSLFLDRLERASARTRRQGGHGALIFIDLDGFKLVNDTFGHSRGDTLLQEASRRIKGAIREADTAARLGGDEFTVILNDLHHGRDAEHVALHLIGRLAEPFDLGGESAHLSASLGITVFPDDAQDVESLVKNADTAMYRAKDLGRNTYSFFTSGLEDEVQERIRIDKELRQALQEDEFELHYQPVVDAATGSIEAAEVLLRWNHPQMGLVFPDTFIDVAEETGLISEIGDWVLQRACRQLADWRAGGLADLRLMVNLSGREFRQGLEEKVAGALDAAGVPAENLVVEVTESAYIHDVGTAESVLQALRARGVSIYIDDFGTGYSSLGYLRRLPVDGLKVDRSFVRDLGEDPEDSALVEAVIALGRSLRLRVVAEGVETEAQRQTIRALGCDLLQGFLFHRPMPAADFLRAVGGQSQD